MAFALGPRAASAGYKLAAFERTGSTNTEAIEHARRGERGPMWFVTSEQTAGRGRRQRPWIAPKGNLAASVLERPTHNLFGISDGLPAPFIVALLASLSGPEVAEGFSVLPWI